MSLLQLQNICKSYQSGRGFGSSQRNQVLGGVNLNIEPGSCMGLLGRSGSGKSTLGRIALGLETPDAGTVFYKGKNIALLKKEEFRNFRRNVQVVFQNSLGSVNGRFRAFDIVAEPLRNFEALTQRQLTENVDQLLRQVGLNPADAGKYPHQFSGGELQRVCIARAIALNPELIVLDEALSSLDMLIQVRIIALLQELQQRLKIAFLFISHDLRVVLRMADRIAIMQTGRIVEHVKDKKEINQHLHPALDGLVKAILPPLPA